MFWVADILLVLYLALFLYRGIKRTGTLNSLLNFTKGLLAMIISIGAAFALSFFVFPMLGWIQDMQLGLLDFGHSFAGILKLANIAIAKNKLRKVKELWTENQDGCRVESFVGTDENNEASYVALQIKNLMKLILKTMQSLLSLTIKKLSPIKENNILNLQTD